MGEEVQWKGFTGEENPEVWNLAAMPEQPTEKKPGQLTPEQVKTYFEEVGHLSRFHTTYLNCAIENLPNLLCIDAAMIHVNSGLRAKVRV